MSSQINITEQDILKQLKLSGKVPEILEGIVKQTIITEEAEKADITIETEELQKAADQFRLLNDLRMVEKQS
ncbi:hypothetical protein [Crocosphaera sp.]|uniref:hypothetical protein n=1 Tax=Crocosphaera sp. TaxID=2729996 RepID=UPI00261C2024|nr:hypothetical protein [Crocosphaera sp.]MDJ0579143.1 hypothetical protein [Crocosphaera sp.]